MSSRVTRSAARLSAANSSSAPQPPQPPRSSDNPSTATHTPTAATSSRKRKAAATTEQSPGNGVEAAAVPQVAVDSANKRPRRKRAKVEEQALQQEDGGTTSVPVPTPPKARKRTKSAATMSNAGPSSGAHEESSDNQSSPPLAATSAKRKTSRPKKDVKDTTGTSTSGRPSQRSSRKPKKSELPPPVDSAVPPKDDSGSQQSRPTSGDRKNSTSEDSNPDAQMRDGYDEEDDGGGDPFEYGFHRRYGGFPGSIRALSGMLSGVSQRLRGLLERMRQKDPTEQLLALTELSELLLVSTEDNLAGHFSPDMYVKELVTLMQPDEIFGENQEIMLLACRCLANLMEALPSATANVVYGGAVPILCQKLLEIHYIDLAEQAISTLEKISFEFPSSIVREGGLTAILSYLEFFPTGTQRTAVTAAANCCRNIPNDSFAVVRDVMPILLNVLASSDQKVLEQGCLCVSRIVQSFRYDDSKLEELVSEDLLKAILRLLLPGTTNLISSNIHTQFLSVLANTARASPQRSVDLLKMNVVDTLYQILTGVSPPAGDGDDVGAKIDSVVIMQALIHRPRDQIFETLNVICELLPNVQRDGLLYLDAIFDAGFDHMPMSVSKKSSNDKRLALFKDCKQELRRFTIILLPTLTDAYSSTVNLSVRQKVLTAQLKMLSNIDTDILEASLRNVSYSSFLASILTQQEHTSLVTFALQAAELLLKRLENIYRYQFYREGVIFEIAKLAARPLKVPPKEAEPAKDSEASVTTGEIARTETNSDHDEDVTMEDIDNPHDDDEDHDDDQSDDDDDDEDDEEHRQHREATSSSDSSSNSPVPSTSAVPRPPPPEDIITLRAKTFIEAHENGNQTELRSKAEGIRDDLKALTGDIKSAYLNGNGQGGLALFQKLASYFESDTLESVTSYELLSSSLVEMLLEVFAEPNPRASEATTAFLEAFMGQGTQTKEKTTNSASPATPFSAFVHKLQELLSRAEHFEVITVGSATYDSSRGSAAGLLAKTLKIRLKADDGTPVPEPLKLLTVSIQAIATLKALDDYLRPRIMLAENPRRAFRDRDVLAGGLAAWHQMASRRGALAAAAAGGRGLPPPQMPTPSDSTNRDPPKRGQTKAGADTLAPTPPAEASGSPAAPFAPRRSARNTAPPAAVSTPRRGPPPPGPIGDPLECADETRLSDGEDLDDDGILDAMLGTDRLDDGTSEDEEAPAVNMEIASTGKVHAHKEDGTRIATPVGSQAPPSRSASGARLVDRTASRRASTRPTEETTPSRPTSYSAALQAPPTNWHLEFAVNDQPVSLETTVYRAVHFNQQRPSDVSARNVWHDVHTVVYKKVPGPYSASTLSPPPESPQTASGVPSSLEDHPTSSAILRLLSLLHGFNANIDDILAENKDSVKLVSEPTSQFVNTKLTAKMNRQLEEPLIVASNCLPSWSEDLARLYPFLFPFETRHLFLQSTSYGYSRSMSRWQTNQQNGDSRHDRHRDDRNPFLGRTQRQKIRISRQKMLESAMKVMDLYGSSPSILEVEYFEEVGTGLGPTLEFYSTVSKEFAKKKLKLWRENESAEGSEFAFGRRGLFPAPMSDEMAETENGKRILNMFTSMGKFVARSMLDSRIIDLNFNSTFFRVGDTAGAGAISPSLGAMQSVDRDLANSLCLLKKFATARKAIDEDPALTPARKVQLIQDIEMDGVRVEDMALDFTLPGYAAIELSSNGANTAVTIDNVAQYIDLVLDFTLGMGVRRQVDAFRAGFSQVFPYAALHAFTPEELVMLFGRVEEDWSLETLMDAVKADHGFNLDSKSVRNLLGVMSGYSMEERRDFLQFVTGSPKLPIGGFKALTPMFTVVCKPSEPPYSSDDYLPSVMTCVNYLKLPDYSSVDIMKAKLNVAIREGQGAFHLS